MVVAGGGVNHGGVVGFGGSEGNVVGNGGGVGGKVGSGIGSGGAWSPGPTAGMPIIAPNAGGGGGGATTGGIFGGGGIAGGGGGGGPGGGVIIIGGGAAGGGGPPKPLLQLQLHLHGLPGGQPLIATELDRNPAVRMTFLLLRNRVAALALPAKRARQSANSRYDAMRVIALRYQADYGEAHTFIVRRKCSST